MILGAGGFGNGNKHCQIPAQRMIFGRGTALVVALRETIAVTSMSPIRQNSQFRPV